MKVRVRPRPAQTQAVQSASTTVQFVSPIRSLSRHRLQSVVEGFSSGWIELFDPGSKQRSNRGRCVQIAARGIAGKPVADELLEF